MMIFHNMIVEINWSAQHKIKRLILIPIHGYLVYLLLYNYYLLYYYHLSHSDPWIPHSLLVSLFSLHFSIQFLSHFNHFAMIGIHIMYLFLFSFFYYLITIAPSYYFVPISQDDPQSQEMSNTYTYTVISIIEKCLLSFLQLVYLLTIESISKFSINLVASRVYYNDIVPNP